YPGVAANALPHSLPAPSVPYRPQVSPPLFPLYSPLFIIKNLCLKAFANSGAMGYSIKVREGHKVKIGQAETE
ncbi:MAG: hypothetical protein LBS10_10320, partial [Gracilibacteraceae bacterium]|nr:hypothetical protein [Gracilibacteraceae bacterium]